MSRIALATWIVAGFAPSWAAAQETILLSGDKSGASGDKGSLCFRGAAATEGSHRLVVFESFATTLVKGDTNGRGDIFLRDVTAGTTARIVLDVNAGEPDGNSANPSITPDGRYVSFESSATDLVKSDKNGKSDVFVLDRARSTIDRISLDENGKEADDDCFAAGISDDGRFVLFTSLSGTLVANDANGTFDVFVHDRSRNQTFCASLATSGATGNGSSRAPTIAADGLKVAFESSATDLVANDTNARKDVFVRDLASDTTERVSVNVNGFELDGTSDEPAIAADGGSIAFRSYATNLHRDATSGIGQIFVRDLSTGEVWLASRGVDGLAADGECSFPAPFIYVGPDGPRALVAFWSVATNLPDDGGADRDAFVTDFRDGIGQCVSVDSAGVDVSGTEFPGELAATPEGDAIVFNSIVDALIPGDANANFDVLLRGLQWTTPAEFGTGLAGSSGFVPRLSGSGGSCEASRWSIEVADGLGKAFGNLWVGFGSTSGIPLFGGTFYLDFAQPLFAIPILLGGPAGVGGAGTLFLDGVDVEDLGQFSLYLQCTFLDARAPKGVSLSNALELAIDA